MLQLSESAQCRRGSRGGEIGEFLPPFFWVPFFLFFPYPSNIEIIFDFSDIITKFTPHFKILDPPLQGEFAYLNLFYWTACCCHSREGTPCKQRQCFQSEEGISRQLILCRDLFNPLTTVIPLREKMEMNAFGVESSQTLIKIWTHRKENYCIRY